MNLNQIINMIIRIFLRRGINWGINKGMSMVSNRDKQPKSMTPQERAQSQQMRDATKRARKAARITRRF